MKKTNAIAFALDAHLLFVGSFNALIEQMGLFSDVNTLNDKRGELTPLNKPQKFISKSSGLLSFFLMDMNRN